MDEVDGDVITAPEPIEEPGEEKESTLTHTFLFAGSHLQDNTPGRPRVYLADTSGNVISIASFGDEVLCLPTYQTQANDALMWQVKPGSLPQQGTEVTLRLRPKTESNEHTPREHP